MMPIILRSTILCLLVAIGPLSGQGEQREVNPLIDALQNKYRRLSTLGADFTQVYHSPGAGTRRESGRLLLKKPGKMRWDYTSPEAKLYVSDGKVIYEYVASEQIATRTTVKEASDLRAPFMFLLGRGDLRRDFSRIETGVESPATAGHQVLRLTPKRAQEFRSLIIEVDPERLQISRLSFIDSSGGRSDFIFSNLRENIPVSDSAFNFRPPAGVQVIIE